MLEVRALPSEPRRSRASPGGRGSVAGLARPAPDAPPRGLVEDDLTQADGLGGHLDALVVGDELEGLLQREEQGGSQADRLVRRGRADVGLLLLLGGIDVHLLVPGVLPDDHALVYLGSGPDQQHAALPQAPQPRAGGRAPPPPPSAPRGARPPAPPPPPGRPGGRGGGAPPPPVGHHRAVALGLELA